MVAMGLPVIWWRVNYFAIGLYGGALDSEFKSGFCYPTVRASSRRMLRKIMEHVATIVFTGHNRREMLREAIVAAQNQTVPLTILVMDDASSDGTSEMMRADFPEIGYYRSSENLGPCYHRNKAIEMAKTEIVFGLDDDSILQSPYTIEQTLAEFDREDIGAVAIPYINILQGDKVHTKAPDDGQTHLVFAFAANACAIRRSAFMAAGCYRETFFYMGEEPELCIRMIERGFVVRLGRADPIHHLRPPNRVSAKVDILERRNDIISFYFNTPLLFLLPYLVGTTLKGLAHGIRVGRVGNTIRGLSQGFAFILSNSNLRNPVSISSFLLYRKIKSRESFPLHELEPYLK